MSDFPTAFLVNRSTIPQKKTSPKTIDSIQKVTEQLILQRFAPASVVINNRGDILYITGHTGKYLEPAAGKANMNIHAMMREGLSHELSDALRKVNRGISPVIVKDVRIPFADTFHAVDITVQRLDAPETQRELIIIVFVDKQGTYEKKTSPNQKSKGSATTRMKKLVEQYRMTQEDLQTTREEMQTSQEELKSINEELQSTNEELQSTNEELTTSKEEMQSMNEELQTVNAELQSKVNDFVRASDDMKNLLNSTEIATLFLDKELNIRRFTDHAQKIMKIRMSDVGRPFTDLVTDLDYTQFGTDVREVLRSLQTREQSISAVNDRWFSIRIMPYRTIDDKVDGVVITFTDITKAKNLEIQLQELHDSSSKKQ
jgi:two-component system CheB/CheR fusion protein